jgi:hypothetical protein
MAAAAIGANAAAANEVTEDSPEVKENTDGDWSDIAKALVAVGGIGAIASAATMSQATRSRITRGATFMAKMTDMEARQKLTAGLLEKLIESKSNLIPEPVAHAVRRLQWAANDLAAEHLRYGDVTKWRNEFREQYKMIGKDGADRINAHLEGLPLDLTGLDDAQKYAVVNAAREIKDVMSSLNAQINEQFRRVGGKDREIFGYVMGLHPSTAPQTGREILSIGKNLWNGVVLGRATGVNKSNLDRIRHFTEQYLRANTRHNGTTIEWAPGRRREMLDVPVDLVGDGKKFTAPDDVTQDQYEAWIKKQSERNANAFFSTRHGNYNPDVDTEFKRKAAYAGPDVHGVIMEDFGNDLELRMRMLNGLKNLPDGALDDLKLVQDHIETINKNAKSVTGTPEADLAEALTDVLANENGLFDDINALTGRPRGRDLKGFRRRVAAAHNALSGPTMQLLLQWNPLVAAKQSPQAALMAAAKSDNWLPIAEIRDQLRGTPYAQAWDQTVGRFIKDANISVERIHSTNTKGIGGKVADMLEALKRSNEVVEAGTVYTAVQDLKRRMFDPSFQSYAQRTWSPQRRAQIREAIQRNDDDAIRKLGAIYVIHQLDMVNGSGVPTSRFNAFSGPITSALMSLANTPVKTAVKTVSSHGKGAVNDAGSRGKNMALAARAGALIGAQAVSNAVVTAYPAAKATALFAGGMPLYGAAMAYRNAQLEDKTLSEQNAENKLRTLGSTVSRMPGELASGDFSGFAKDLGGLARYTAAETVGGKFVDAGSSLASLRSSIDQKLGAPRSHSENVADYVTGSLPTIFGIPSIVLDVWRQATSDQPELLYGASSPFPLLRALSWQNDIDLRRRLEKPQNAVDKALEDARKGLNVNPTGRPK